MRSTDDFDRPVRAINATVQGLDFPVSNLCFHCGKITCSLFLIEEVREIKDTPRVLICRCRSCQKLWVSPSLWANQTLDSFIAWRAQVKAEIKQGIGDHDPEFSVPFGTEGAVWRPFL